MHQKDSLYAYALKDASNRDRGIDAAIALGDDGALVGLHPFFSAFLNPNTDANGVAHVDFGKVTLNMVRF